MSVGSGAYTIGGTNTFFITNPVSCIGYATDAALSSNYARVTVTYTTGPPPCATPTAVTASPSLLCAGAAPIDLNAISAGNDIYWYDVSSGGSALGSPVASGSTFTTSPISSTTTFYAEALGGGCTVSPRTAITVTVSSSPAAPTPTTASPSSVFCGTSSDLNATSAGNNILWYTEASGGTSIGSSASEANYNVLPLTTTTYYAEAAAPGTTSTLTFNYTGALQTFTVPAGVTSLTVDAYGAQGANNGGN